MDGPMSIVRREARDFVPNPWDNARVLGQFVTHFALPSTSLISSGVRP